MTVLPLDKEAAAEKIIRMAERCEYHWFYVKRRDAVVCEACGDPIESNPRYRALSSDHWISETQHSGKCGRAGVGGFLVMHLLATGESCEGSVPVCSACSTSAAGTAWEMTGAGETLTLAPSILCVTHGDHGFVRDGRWVPA